MTNDNHTLDQLQAHPARPAAEPRATVRTFNALMRAQAPTPSRMPPAEGGAVNAAQAWKDAISGRAPQFTGQIDSRAAASQWLGQTFVSDEENARKAIVEKALAERDARLAAVAAPLTAAAVPVPVAAAPVLVTKRRNAS